MKLGIVGVGVVGGALASYLKKHDHEIVLDDPPREIVGDCSDVEALFICVPVETIKDKHGRAVQDYTILKTVLKKYEKPMRGRDVPIFIRSTVLPKTCDNLRKTTKLRIHAMPEFLTERAADDTFAEQDILCGCDDDPKAITEMEDLLDKIFPDKEIHLVRNREAELAKYAHNVMGAIKVNLFNMISKYAERIQASYENVLEGVLLSGYVNREHTQVPGPDGKYGFAGKCFPKDTLALIGEMKRMGLQSGSLDLVMFENFLIRTQRMSDFKIPEIVYPEITVSKVVDVKG